MRILSFILLATFIAIACYEDKYGQNLNFMAHNARAFLAKQAIDHDCTLSIYQFQAISYDTVSENFVDTVELLLIQNEMLNYSEQLDNLTVNISSDMDAAQEYRKKGWGEMVDRQMSKVRKKYARYLSLIDSLAYYVSRDSIVRDRIVRRLDPIDIYRFEAFVNAKFRNGDAMEVGALNDTIVVFFDTQFEIFKNRDE